MMDSPERLALIVGGAKGIGREISRLLAAEGMRTIVVDADKTALTALARDFTGLEVHALDITDRTAVREFVAALSAAGDHFDFVVMSAAVHGACPIEAMSDEFIEKIFRVNIVDHAKFLRDVLPQLKDGARIVGLSSNSAEIGIPMEAVYAASKAGMERVYEALAIEAAHRHIRPLLIQTGNVNTGFNETGNDYEPEGEGYVANSYRAVIDKIDSRNGISPEAVAKAAVRLLRAARPPFRTLIGMNAIKVHWAKRLLGTDLALRLVVGALAIRRPDKDVLPSPSAKPGIKKSS